MKRYLKELIVLLIQIFMFYVYPLFTGPTEVIFMVLMMLLVTFLLSFILGIISSNKIKYLYPVVTPVLFLPSIFIYYNISALVHALWYLVLTSVGMLMGSIIRILAVKIARKR